jgi:SAM-dependent methyltransferase
VTAVDRWTGGDDYEAFIGRWSRRIAGEFVPWLGVPAGARWVDVGAGTGALTAAILERAAPASVIGVEPSSDFLGWAGQSLTDPRARWLVGDAAALPLEIGSVDVVVSGLVLNFVPDVPAALAEFRRVAVPGAVVAAYVWDYRERMEPLRRFWDAAVELDPTAAPADEAQRFPLCAPERLVAAFAAAGLSDVAVGALGTPARFASFDDYWRPFLSRVGPAPGYVATLSEDRRDALRERLRATLPTAADGSIALNAGAWAVRGRTPNAPAAGDGTGTDRPD